MNLNQTNLNYETSLSLFLKRLNKSQEVEDRLT
jgi:hypothetical protein